MNKQIVGYTTGVFDLFHIGHLYLLKNARKICDFLIVGVTTDEISEIMKGRKPIIPFSERVEIVRSIRYVDEVVPKESTNNALAWEKIKFDIMIKGDDWKGTQKGDDLEAELSSIGVSLQYLRYTKHTSSSILREAILKLSQQIS